MIAYPIHSSIGNCKYLLAFQFYYYSGHSNVYNAIKCLILIKNKLKDLKYIMSECNKNNFLKDKPSIKVIQPPGGKLIRWHITFNAWRWEANS